MKRMGLILMAVLLSGCWFVPYGYTAPQTPTPAPTFAIPFLTPPPTSRPIDMPSGSCIFTLDIANETSYLVRVQINGLDVRTVNPRATLRLMDHEEGLPPMPWDVLLVKAVDGRMLTGASFNADEVEGYLVARDGEASRSSRECAPG